MQKSAAVEEHQDRAVFCADGQVQVQRLGICA